MNAARNTIQKALIRQAVQQLDHPTAEAVFAAVQENHPSLSRGTVYRNLQQMWERGELLKIPVADEAYHFDHNTAPHCHAHCRVCGRLCDVEVLPDALPEKALAPESGFQAEGYHLLFFGKCANCAKL